MPEPAASPLDAERGEPSEVARLNKVVRALMDRAERSTSLQGSEFNLFQTAIMLQEQVRHRTAELETVLRENEGITRALRESEAMFRGLVNQFLVGVVIIEDGKFTYSNAKFDEMLGYSAAETRRMGPLDVVIDTDRALVAEKIRQRVTGEAEHLEYVVHGLRKDGSVIVLECHGSKMDIADRSVLITLSMDITERVRVEHEVQVLQDELREQSTHDALTGLYNRRYLEESFERELALAMRSSLPISVIMADLDHFKTVNDIYGHPAGDAVLRSFAALLKTNARASDIFSRYGGEEFLLVLPGMDEPTAVERAEQLRRTLAETPIIFGDSQIRVTVSFGIATFPSHGQTSAELIGAADRALYAAKAAGRDRVVICV